MCVNIQQNTKMRNLNTGAASNSAISLPIYPLSDEKVEYVTDVFMSLLGGYMEYDHRNPPA